MTEASAYLGFTILYVPDVEAAIAFYEQAESIKPLQAFLELALPWQKISTGAYDDSTDHAR